MLLLTVFVLFAGVCGLNNTNWLKIVSKPEREIYVTVGYPYSLECSAIGAPAPKIFWSLFYNQQIVHKRNDRFYVDKTELLVPKMAKITSIYTIKKMPKKTLRIVCTANNGILQTKPIITTLLPMHDKRFINLVQGQYVRPVLIYEYYNFAFSVIGQSVILKCQSQGFPTPTVTWFGPNNCSINGLNDIEVMINGNLWIKNVTWPMLGNYACLASNNYSKDSIVTFLYPTATNSNNSL